MKKTKKLVNIILVILLVTLQFSPFLNVKAITLKGENSEGIREDLVVDTANLIVYNVSNGDTLSAYKVLDTFYNSVTNEITYGFTSDFQGFLDQSTNDTYKNLTIDDYFLLTSDEARDNCTNCVSVITTSTLNKLVSNYATYIRKNNITGIDMITDTSSSTATATVVAGSYLILPKTIETQESNSDYDLLEKLRYLYGVMVGNVVFTVGSSGWELKDVGIYAKSSRSGNRMMIAPFSMRDFVSGNVPEESFVFFPEISSVFLKNHGLIIEVSVPDLPTNAINKVLKFEIEFPQGITYDSENIYLATEDFTEINDGIILNNDG